MKHLRYLLMAALVAMPLTACDEDDDTTTPIAPVIITGTVSGTVSIEGTGVAGVSVSLVGSSSQTATTSSSGGYTFTGVEGGSYGVAISGVPADATFATTSATTSITTQGQTVTVDFSGSYIRTSAIAGQVMVDGMGLAGIAVTATGAEGASSAVTDNGGNYSFSGLRGGDYTIAISNVPVAYTFATVSNAVTVGTGEAKIVSFFGVEVVTVDPVTASVVIKSVTFFNGVAEVPVNPAAVAGQINVTLEIDPGQNDLNKIALLLNGTEIASQTLSNTVAGEGAVIEQAGTIFQVIFSLNTAVFNATTGVATYTNGAYALSASLGLDNALTTNVVTSINLTFANLDTFIGVVTPAGSLVGGATSTNAGALFYGGGATTAGVTPVVYSGRTVAAVTTTFTDTGASGTTAITDVAAPFLNTYTLAAYASATIAGTGNEAITITAAAYSDGTAYGPANGGVALPLAMTNGANFFIDNASPTVAALVLTQQVTADALCCSNNWTNPSYAVAGGYTLAGDNAGAVAIGGVTGQIFGGAATATNATIAGGTAMTTIADAALTTPSLVNTVYALAHVETDLLGNATAATRMTGLGDNLATTFGIDNLAPGTQIVGGAATRLINPAAGGTWTFAGTEDRAGFSATFTRAVESLFNTGGTSYPNYGVALTGAMLNYPTPLAATDNTMTAGYYDLTAYIIDQGGNAFATSVTRETLIDITAPVAQNVQIPGSLVGGALTTFTAPVTDNLDLITADFDFQFSANASGFWPFGDPASTDRVLGTAWDATLTTTATATGTINFVSTIETTLAGVPTGTITAAQFVRIGAVDAAANKSVAQVNNFAVGTVTPTVAATASYGAVVPAPAMAGFFIATSPATAAATNLCNGNGAACAAADTKSITVTVTTTGASGTYAPPFASGFIYLYVNDPVAGGFDDAGQDDNNYLVSRQVGATGVVTDTGGVRTYTYTFTITSADVAGIANGTVINILAIGVDSSGAGIQSQLDATFTVVNGS